nr:porin-like protein H [uncultured bacterium]
MKKTILATAITALFASTAAQAASIYDKDGMTVELSGDVEIVAMQPVDSDGTTIAVDEADFGFALGYDVGNDITAVGALAFAADGGTASVDEAYVGVETKWGTLTVGQQYTIFDDAGIGGDYQFGFSKFYEQDASGAQVVKYKLDTEQFYGGFAWLKDTEASPTATSVSGFDANIGMRVADFDFTLFYGDVDTASAYNFEARWMLDKLTLAAAIASTDWDLDAPAGADDKWGTTSSYGITADYMLNEKVTLAAGLAGVDEDFDESLSVQYFLNASYALSPNVNTYVELGGNDADDSEFGYAAGMQVFF